MASSSTTIEYEIRENVLFVKGFSNDLSEKYIRVLFGSYGNIIHLQILRNADRGPVAFVNYDSVRAADNAISKLNGVSIRQSPISISKAKRRLNKSGNCVETNKSFETAEHKVENYLNTLNEKSLCELKRMTSVKNLTDLPIGRLDSIDDYVSSATIDVLTEELLIEVFEYLTLKQKFGIQRVCHLWRNIVRAMISCEPTLTFGRKPALECTDVLHSYDEYNDLTDALIQYNGKAVLKDFNLLAPIIRPMENIVCLQFADCFLQTIALKWIITQSPNLKCLRFDNIQGIGRLDWPKLAKPLSTKLIHFSFSGNTLNDWNSLSAMVTSFVSLEQLIIADCIQDLYRVFQNMSQTVTKLSIIRCDRLNAEAIRALRRRNGPNIVYIEVDFAFNIDCVDIIDSIYSTFDCLQYFRAINIQKDIISRFDHDVNANAISIVYTGFVDLNHPIVVWADCKGLVSLEISGSIRPTALENFSNRFPNCKSLKLIDCRIVCECHLNRDLNCSQCYEMIQRFIFLESSLRYVNLNGDEYDKD